MNEECEEPVNLSTIKNLLQPLTSSLAEVTSAIGDIKKSLISRDILDDVISNQKAEIDQKLSKSESRIAELEKSLNNQKNLLAQIKKQLDDFQNQSTQPPTAFPQISLKIRKKLIVVGDSLVRHLDLKRICPNEDNLLQCIPGARIGTIRRILYKLADKYEADHIVIVVGANHHQEDSHVLSGKARFLLKEAKELFAESKIHYSAYLPKFSDMWIPYIQDFNERMKKSCWAIGVDFIYNSQFVINGAANQRLLAKDGLHLSRKGVATLGSNIKYRVRTYTPKLPYKMKPGRSVESNPDLQMAGTLLPVSGDVPGHQNVIDGKYVPVPSNIAIGSVSDSGCKPNIIVTHLAF